MKETHQNQRKRKQSFPSFQRVGTFVRTNVEEVVFKTGGVTTTSVFPKGSNYKEPFNRGDGSGKNQSSF